MSIKDLSGSPESMSLEDLEEAIYWQQEFLCNIDAEFLMTPDILAMPVSAAKLQKLDELCNNRSNTTSDFELFKRG